MNLRISALLLLAWLGPSFYLAGQGYIVPNGVTYQGFQAFGYEIDVVHDPTNMYYTGFFLDPKGKTPPTATFTNTFLFDQIADVGVRVFLVASNDPISLQAILGTNYGELSFPNTYVFNSGTPFYMGLYTGNVQQAPRDGVYSDPLFGWVKLVNNRGVIQFLDGAIEYQGGGIYAGTRNIIVPEPSALALIVLGALLLRPKRLRK